MTITPDQLKQWRELCERSLSVGCDDCNDTTGCECENLRPTLDFATESRTAMPLLMDELEAANAREAELQQKYNARFKKYLVQENILERKYATEAELYGVFLLILSEVKEARGASNAEEIAYDLERIEELATDVLSEPSQAYEKYKARLSVVEAAKEIKSIIEGYLDGNDYKFDSYTLQPLTEALDNLRAGDENG